MYSGRPLSTNIAVVKPRTKSTKQPRIGTVATHTYKFLRKERYINHKKVCSLSKKWADKLLQFPRGHWVIHYIFHLNDIISRNLVWNFIKFVFRSQTSFHSRHSRGYLVLVKLGYYHTQICGITLFSLFIWMIFFWDFLFLNCVTS